MKTLRFTGACVLLLAALSLSSCDLIEKLLGGTSISVTLSGPTSIHWKETGTWTATADSSSSVSYQWYVDGVAQNGSTNTISLTAISDTASTHSVSVTATSGSSSDTDSMNFNTLARPFSVNLTGPTSLMWGEDGAYSSGLSSAVDADGNTLTFVWYLDDVPQTNLSSSSYSIIFTPQPNTNSSSTADISVTVSNGYGSLSSTTTTVSIGAPTLLRLENLSGVSAYYWYNKLSSSTVWSSDMLGDAFISSGYTSLYYRLMPGTYDLEVEDISHTVLASIYNQVLLAGYQYTWTINPLSGSLLPSVTDREALPIQQASSPGFSMRAAQ
jgi:hypothetical protein